MVGSQLNRAEPTENRNLVPRLDPKAFTFPLDVTNADQGLGNHGHYILFFINEQAESKISFGKKEASASGFSNLIKAESQNGISPEASGPGQVIDGLSGRELLKKELTKEKGSVIRESANTAVVKRPATTRLDTAIALYMPPTVSVTYTANYTDTVSYTHLTLPTIYSV